MSTASSQDMTPEALEGNRKYRRSELPRPYPDPDAWDQNLTSALESPERKKNYEIFLNSEKSLTVDYLPVRLDVENVSRCNYRCTMCQVSDWGPTFQRAQDMAFEEFKDLIDSQYGLIEVKLQGMGEPLLGREVFFKMIQYARSKHIWVRTTHNGALLHFRDNYKKLIDSGINEVQISIDGADKETFEGIRVGSNFDLVKSNCLLLNNYCDENDLLRTRMWTVLQQSNLKGFLDFVHLAHELKFKRQTFTLSLTEWGQDKWSKANRSVTAEDSITPEIANEAIELGKQLGVEVTFWDVTEKYSVTSKQTLCRWPWERTYVSSDMKLVPCCMIANPNVLELGDASDLSKTWNSEAYQDFRRAHLEGRIPKVCRFCYQDG